MTEIETLTPTESIAANTSPCKCGLTLRLARPEDFYRMVDGKKMRHYGMIYYAEHCVVDGIRHFTLRRFSRHELSRMELAELLRQNKAYVQDGYFILEENKGRGKLQSTH